MTLVWVSVEARPDKINRKTSPTKCFPSQPRLHCYPCARALHSRESLVPNRERICIPAPVLVSLDVIYGKCIPNFLVFCAKTVVKDYNLIRFTK